MEERWVAFVEVYVGITVIPFLLHCLDTGIDLCFVSQLTASTTVEQDGVDADSQIRVLTSLHAALI